MTNPTNPSNLFSPFLPSTFNMPEEEDRHLDFIGKTFSQLSDVINDKKIGLYAQNFEVFNGNTHFYATTSVTRNGYQTFAYIRRLPNAGVLTLTLDSDPAYPITNVNEQLLMWHTWGTASRPCSENDTSTTGDGDYFSFSNMGDPRITYTVSNKQIVITTTVDLSSYYCFIVLEYIRAGTNET